MAKRHGGKEDEGTAGGDDREPGGIAHRPAWHAGHLPRMPRTPSDDEPDFVTGLLRERSLDGLLGDGAEDPPDS
jgi:hypothetical protein